MLTHAATAGEKWKIVGKEDMGDIYSSCYESDERDVVPAIRQTKRWADGARYNYCDSTCRLENHRFRCQGKDSSQSQYVKVDTKKTLCEDNADPHPLGKKGVTTYYKNELM